MAYNSKSTKTSTKKKPKLGSGERFKKLSGDVAAKADTKKYGKKKMSTMVKAGKSKKK